MRNVNSLNKIGSVKVVNGFTFTLVEKTKYVYTVQITVDGTDFLEYELVAHNTWKSGRFIKVTKAMIKKLSENEQ